MSKFVKVKSTNRNNEGTVLLNIDTIIFIKKDSYRNIYQVYTNSNIASLFDLDSENANIIFREIGMSL